MNSLYNLKLVGPLLILILASCTSIQKDEKEKGSILHIPIEKKDGIMHINADSIFESIEYIPLETTEENLLSGMEYLSTKVYNDTIYIWDRNLQQLIQYDGKGKYLKKLSRRGNGPGEYIKVWDFLVLDTTVCLLSEANKKIIFYRKSDFTYLYSVPIPVSAVQMSKYGKFLYLFSGNWSPEKFNIYVMDIETGEVISRYHEFTSRGVYYVCTTFNRAASHNYYFMQYDYHIYEAQPFGNRIVYTLDFGEENMFDEQFLSLSDIEKEAVLKKKYPDIYSLKNKKISGIDDLYCSDGMIFFTFVLGITPYCYVQMENDYKPHVGYITSSTRFPFASNRVADVNEMYMYCLLEAEYMIDRYVHSETVNEKMLVPQKLFKQLKPDDNPVMCRYTWKK